MSALLLIFGPSYYTKNSCWAGEDIHVRHEEKEETQNKQTFPLVPKN